MNLQPIHASKVRELWPGIRSQLDHLLEKMPDHWIPEDVFSELMAGTAFLYLIEHEDDNLGFTVLKNFHDASGLVLFVWIIASEPMTLFGDSMVNGQNTRYEQVVDEFDKLARNIGAKRIRYCSQRNGWMTKGLFKLKMHIYEREV